jgi:hypothetical protein
MASLASTPADLPYELKGDLTTRLIHDLEAKLLKFAGLEIFDLEAAKKDCQLVRIVVTSTCFLAEAFCHFQIGRHGSIPPPWLWTVPAPDELALILGSTTICAAGSELVASRMLNEPQAEANTNNEGSPMTPRRPGLYHYATHSSQGLLEQALCAPPAIATRARPVVLAESGDDRSSINYATHEVIPLPTSRGSGRRSAAVVGGALSHAATSSLDEPQLAADSNEQSLA